MKKAAEYRPTLSGFATTYESPDIDEENEVPGKVQRSKAKRAAVRRSKLIHTVECGTTPKIMSSPRVSYLKLKDIKNSIYEYFPLYKDTDIGFSQHIQNPPESVNVR